MASLAFIEARLDRYGGGEALSVCPLSLPLCDYKFDAPQEQKSEFEYEVEYGRGLRDPFSGHSDCVLSHKYQQATDGIVSPGDHPTASGRSAFRGRLQSGVLNDRRIGPRSDSRPDGRRLARSLPYTSLLYNVETETMMSTEIETRVRGGIVIPSVCGGVE